MLSSTSLVNVKLQRNETKSLKLHTLEITEELVSMLTCHWILATFSHYI